MRDMYRPRTGLWQLSLPGLMLLAAAVLGLAVAVGWKPPVAPRDGVSTALLSLAASAERTMVEAEAALRIAKRNAGIRPAPEAGPGASALIGDELTSLVTTLGSLEAKTLAASPRWAGALVMRLAEAGIGPGSVVAAGFSGSFPGLNLAVTAACQALGAELLAISSVTASTWGANQPGFTWPEIERRLVWAGLVRHASIAVTVGGSEDRGLDLDADGRALARRIMEDVARDLGVAALDPPNYYAAVDERLALYDAARQGRPVALYVNVGGTDASLGRSPVVLRLGNGFLPGVAFDSSRERGVVARFAERGVPILMLLNIRDLALGWKIPLGGARMGGPAAE